MQNNIMKRFDATACAQSRCFECNLWVENMITFVKATCLWSSKSLWILRGNTVHEIWTEEKGLASVLALAASHHQQNQDRPTSMITSRAKACPLFGQFNFQYWNAYGINASRRVTNIVRSLVVDRWYIIAQRFASLALANPLIDTIH